MKKIILIFIVVFSPSFIWGQWKHSFSVNMPIYSNFFSKNIAGGSSSFIFCPDKALPEISYKLEKKNHGLEVYYNQYTKNYRSDPYAEPYTRDYIKNSHSTFGLNYQYKLFQNNFIELNPLMGLNIGWNEASRIYNVEYNEIIYGNPILLGGPSKYLLGVQLGFNYKIPVWNGFFIGGNLKHTFRTWQEETHLKNNMLFTAGIGYAFGKKKENIN